MEANLSLATSLFIPPKKTVKHTSQQRWVKKWKVWGQLTSKIKLENVCVGGWRKLEVEFKKILSQNHFESICWISKAKASESLLLVAKFISENVYVQVQLLTLLN